MPDIEKLRQWSYHKQRLGRQGNDALDVIKAVIAIYSWHPTAALSLHARIKRLDEDAFHRLDEKKLALRIPAMRLSVHMAPQETAADILAATIPTANDPYWEKRYDEKKIPKAKYQDYRKEILKVCITPMTVAEIKEASGIPEDAVKFLLNRIAFEGDILRLGAESLRSNIISYVATKTWLKRELKAPDRDKAFQWLAGEYLRVFGPARVKDFQWWTSSTVSKAKAAISAHPTVDIGDGYLLLAEEQKDYDNFKTGKLQAIDILPQWDCYTMGYAPDGRQRFVNHDGQQHIYGKLGATGGNGLGTVLVNGLAHAVWDARFTGTKMNISLNTFEKTTAKQQKEIETCFEEIAHLLKANSILITKK